MSQRVLRTCVSLTLAALLLMAGGCSTYAVRGKVIEGAAPAVVVVDQDDPRLERPGVTGAIVLLTLEPDRLNAREVGADVSDVEGDYTIPVDEFGAGTLLYDTRVTARLQGYKPTVGDFSLPSRGKRVLVILAPGADEGRPAAREEEDLLDETLRLSEPYR